MSKKKFNCFDCQDLPVCTFLAFDLSSSPMEFSLKKAGIFFLFTLAILFVLWAQEEDLIDIDASINPQRLSKGQAGKIVLKFTTEKDVTINPQPSFTIELSPSDDLVFSKNFFTASDLEIEILKEDGKEYLDLTKQIEIPFAVSEEAVRGLHTLEGKVKYFAYSKEEKWCLKTTTQFSTSFYTRDAKR
jgi:hypothetical protein